MREVLTELLAAKGIDTVGFLRIEDCRVFQPHLLPAGVKSCAVWLIPYYTGPHPERNVSLYAVSKDYHLFSRALAEELKPKLSEAFPDDGFWFFCDSSPIGEVAAAVATGLGCIGRNRLLISEKYGSYVFIGSVLSTRELEKDDKTAPKTCPGCGACERACDFLCGKSGVCASELNQRKALSDGELAAVKARKIRWGCDVCQEVCPMNRDVPNTPIPFFYEEQIETVTPELLEGMSKADFKARAFAWRGKKTILRNVTE